MKLATAVVPGVLLLLPLVAASPFPRATAAPGSIDLAKFDSRYVHDRHLRPRQSQEDEEKPPATETSTSVPSSTSSATSTSSSTTTKAEENPEDEEKPPSSTSSSTSTVSSTSTTPGPKPNEDPKTTPATSFTESDKEIINEDGETTTIRTRVPYTPTGDNKTDDSDDKNKGDDKKSNNQSTIIGIGVAGGIAALAAIAFLVWKFTNKRFSQFDNDDGAPINWPDLKEPTVVPTRPAPSVAGTTTSSLDLSKDPYAVPPMPQGGGNSYYDPYRGPVPQTFATPPASHDGHEVIPMGAYPSGRASPGPSLAYSDPYAAAPYAAPMIDRTGTPVQRLGTPGVLVDRTGTPIQRMGTPGAYLGPPGPDGIPRQGTPGVPPYMAGGPQDISRQGTPLSYGRASPGPALAYGQAPMQGQPGMGGGYDQYGRPGY